MLKALMIFLIIAILLGLLWFGIGWFERSNLFYPTPDWVATPAEAGLIYEDVAITTSDEQTLSAWYIPASTNTEVFSPSKGLTVLLFHGNGGNISHRIDKIAKLQRLGVNVFIIDYRGFGKSSGNPTEQGLYLDGEAAITFLRNKKNTSLHQIIFYGESLGGAIATEMAFRHEAHALILEDTFTSVAKMSEYLFHWLPSPKYLVQNRFDTISKIPAIKSPVLIFHSTDDETVPYFMGEELSKAAPKGTQFIRLTGPHNDAYALCAKQYIEAIQQLLQK